MDLTPLAALDRTALLISDDLLRGQVSKEAVVEGLLQTSTQIVAPAHQLATPAGQTAVVTLALHLAMCGISIDLQIADVDLAAPQPPLTGPTLRSALDKHIRHAWPWLNLAAQSQPDVRFIIGATTPITATDIVVSGTTEQVVVGPAERVQGMPWAGSWPIAPIAAGIAAASLAVRATVLQLALLRGTADHLVLPTSNVVNLSIPTTVSNAYLGDVPIVSAGAITHALLFTVLRVPGAHGRVEVFDDDLYDAPNFNRYPLARADELGTLKALALGTYSTSDLAIIPQPHRYVAGTRAGVDRILVGADDIEVRWTAQHDVRGWLGIGATSHLFSQVSTHPTGGPCAGCIHRLVDDLPETIPTISIISGWAGLLLANELLRLAGGEHAPRLLSSFPLGMGGRYSHTETLSSFNSLCVLGCRAHRATA